MGGDAAGLAAACRCHAGRNKKAAVLVGPRPLGAASGGRPPALSSVRSVLPDDVLPTPGPPSTTTTGHGDMAVACGGTKADRGVHVPTQPNRRSPPTLPSRHRHSSSSSTKNPAERQNVSRPRLRYGLNRRSRRPPTCTSRRTTRFRRPTRRWPRRICVAGSSSSTRTARELGTSQTSARSSWATSTSPSSSRSEASCATDRARPLLVARTRLDTPWAVEVSTGLCESRGLR
jgi:hypothetical protein